MGNSTTFEIEGQDKVILKMTFGRKLTLNNVLYVLDIRKNLVSGSLLSKHRFQMDFESDNFVLIKKGLFCWKGYEVGGMFKLNVMVVKSKRIIKIILLLTCLSLLIYGMVD